MHILLKSLKLFHPDFPEQPSDYIYTGSEITASASIKENRQPDEIIDCTGLEASEGWVDLRCATGEPGEEYKESLDSLGEVLKHSGFVKAVILPNTHPCIQSKGDIRFFKSKTENWFSDLIIQAAVTKGCDGEDFTDMLDIQAEGVRIFGDGTKPLANSDRMMKALQYLQRFDGILFDQSFDPLLALFGQMHEGEASTRLGLKGMPSMSEEIAVHKNLEILKYTGGKLHFQTISTRGAVQEIREAKSKGLNVTADVSLYQLLFSDTDLTTFDSNLKVVPPFRGQNDRKALIEGLLDGTIDALVSNHQPQDFDSKHMEFDLASSGIIGLQTFLNGLNKLSEEIDFKLLLNKITKGPQTVLDTPSTRLETLTVFDRNETWQFDKSSNKSNSNNSPWWNQTMTGKVKFVINKGQFQKL